MDRGFGMTTLSPVTPYQRKVIDTITTRRMVLYRTADSARDRKKYEIAKRTDASIRKLDEDSIRWVVREFVHLSTRTYVLNSLNLSARRIALMGPISKKAAT